MFLHSVMRLFENNCCKEKMENNWDSFWYLYGLLLAMVILVVIFQGTSVLWIFDVKFKFYLDTQFPFWWRFRSRLRWSIYSFTMVTWLEALYCIVMYFPSVAWQSLGLYYTSYLCSYQLECGFQCDISLHCLRSVFGLHRLQTFACAKASSTVLAWSVDKASTPSGKRFTNNQDCKRSSKHCRCPEKHCSKGIGQTSPADCYDAKKLPWLKWGKKYWRATTYQAVRLRGREGPLFSYTVRILLWCFGLGMIVPGSHYIMHQLFSVIGKIKIARCKQICGL